MSTQSFLIWTSTFACFPAVLSPSPAASICPAAGASEGFKMGLASVQAFKPTVMSGVLGPPQLKSGGAKLNVEGADVRLPAAGIIATKDEATMSGGTTISDGRYTNHTPQAATAACVLL